MRFLTTLLLLLPLQPVLFAHADAAICSLCITEVQTQGLGGATEEYVVLTNNTPAAYNMTAHTLRYLTAGGTPNTKTIALSGILDPGANISFVSDSLKTANPSLAQIPSGLALADSGGSLQLLKNGVMIDQIAWGTSTVKYINGGSTASPHDRGWSIVRKQNSSGAFQDTGDDNSDFMPVAHACQGLSLNEIQPLTIDPDGNDLTQSLELLKTADVVGDQDCPIAINNMTVHIAAGDLGTNAGLAVITGVIDASDRAVPLALNTDMANSFQFLPQNIRGEVLLPGAQFTQPVLLGGQTYAKFSSGFKATYQPTIGAANQLKTTPLTPVSETPAVQPVCSDVVLNELLPNPLGDDSGQEWAEFTNTSDQTVSVAGCVLQVNGTNYTFGPDQFIDPGQFLVLGSFSDGISTHTLSLKNSDVNTVSLGHLNTSGFEPLQTVQYADAPEGQTWARFDDGWRWITPTPAAQNTIAAPTANPELTATEFAAPTPDPSTVPATDGGNSAPDQTPAATLNITELLPNPAAPGTDDADEFVELYNPNDEPVNLANYKLQTGNNYTYDYTFSGGTLLGHQYAAFYSRDSGLVLANSSGRARLSDPAGRVVSETDPYDTAAAGESWAQIDGIWQWTLTPTPSAVNIASIPLLGGSAKSKTAKASASASAKPKTPTKTTAAKTTAAKAAKTPAAANRQAYQDPAAAPPTIHPGILAGVGVITLVYAGYEYRHDAINSFRRLRRYREVRRATRAATAGR